MRSCSARCCGSIGAAMLAAACGGGGGDGGGGGGAPAPPEQPASLNDANYAVAAQETMVAASFFFDDASSGSITGAQTVEEGELLRFGRVQRARLPGWLAEAPRMVVATDYQRTFPCQDGGSVTVTWNDRDNDFDLSAGDIFALSFSQCAEAGATADGQLRFDFHSVSGDLLSSYYSVSYTVTYVNLKIAHGADSVTGDGGMRVSETSSGTYVLDDTLHTDRFTIDSVFGGASYRRAVSNFDGTVSMRPDANVVYTVAWSATGRVSSSALGGYVDLSTPTPFERRYGAAYPHAGVGVAVGANNRSVRLTVRDSANVRIEFDADGNGTYDISVDRSWSQVY